MLGEDDGRGRRREGPAVDHVRGAAALNGLFIWRRGSPFRRRGGGIPVKCGGVDVVIACWRGVRLRVRD